MFKHSKRILDNCTKEGLFMTSRLISPVDGRYSNISTGLSEYFSEWALMKNRVKIEFEWTTQIESHDYMAECFHVINRFNNITLSFDRDIWMYISRGYFKQSLIQGEVGSSTMPHKVNPINFETSEANVGLSNSILSHLADKLQVSRLQRDLSDSSAQRNIGSGIAYSFISMHYAIIGFKRLLVNKEAIDNDLSCAWEVIGEAIQTVMRKSGYSNPYEVLKELTRGKNVVKEDIVEFINKLVLPDADKKRLLELTPSKYIGIAPKLVDHVK